MRQCSLVAWLGTKQPELERLVAGIHGLLDVGFEPLAMERIHATVVGLERAPGSSMANANLLRFRGEKARMDVSGFLDRLLTGGWLPLRVRFGGFGPSDRPFDSRGRTPRDRSFSIQGGRAVLIGWPIGSSSGGVPFPDTLDRVRREAGRFRILHAYHRSRDDVDNDCYLRLGTFVRESANPETVAVMEDRIRRHLSAMAPVTVTIARSDLRLVSYLDETLPPGSSRSVALGRSAPSAEQIRAMYD